MEQSWRERLLWWICEKLSHPFINKTWIYNNYRHKECRVCGRIISEPLKESANEH
jgi:hypothetical protein